MIPAYRFLLIAAAFAAQVCHAAETLITTAHYPNGETVPYVLNYTNPSPRYVIILFPGGMGTVNPRMEDGKLTYAARGNFLVRSRKFIVDDEFSTVLTNASPNEERIQVILDDLKNRFPTARIYLMGTSRGTFDTLQLAEYLSDKIAGEIHTSSLDRIASFNAKKYKNRHLVVHHKRDRCFTTPFNRAQYSHEQYGNDFIAMEGGTETGDPCHGPSHHSYNGIEKETIDAIKQWIKQGDG